MNQEKIGKLIAKMRREKGLTQSELGDKVGVGYRAVSKWERGQTLPDISIINKLSEILGISSDELLKGELNENRTPSKKDYHPLIFTLSIIIPLIIIITLIIILNKNKVYIYDLFPPDDNDYYVTGKVTFKNDSISIYINSILFHDNEFLQKTIRNYEYNITSNDRIIIGYGFNPTTDELDMPITIEKFTNSFVINYIGDNPLSMEEIVKNKLILNITFLDEQNEEYSKEIIMTLVPHK